MIRFHTIKLVFLVGFLFSFTSGALAQQGRGLFISTFGKDAPTSYGDQGKFQATYFDIPKNESYPIYLRLFDPDVGGKYDERHGRFDTETRFIVLGGESAADVYASTINNKSTLNAYNTDDIIIDRTFGNNGIGDGRWYSLTQLPLSKGFDLGNGKVRFCLISIGGSGDDGNFYDLALSYNENRKQPPPYTNTFVYSLTLRIPSLLLYDMDKFEGQIKLSTNGVEELNIHTFDMDDVPVDVQIPFRNSESIQASGDGSWNSSNISLFDKGNPEWIGYNFNGRDFNNTFMIYFTNQSDQLLPIDLPIVDYEPLAYPEFSYKINFKGADCKTVDLQTYISKLNFVESFSTTWYIKGDTIKQNSILVDYDSLGYKPFTWKLRAKVAGKWYNFEANDSLLINQRPIAFAGGNRANIANNSMPFDGTVSYDPDGFITKYEWDFGDGTSGSGARIDKVYEKPGEYVVRLKVYDNSESQCGFATSESRVKINISPKPKIIGPELVQLGEEFTLDASQSNDPDGKITEYLWQIGTDTLLEGPIVRYALNSTENTNVILQIQDDAKTFNSLQRANWTIKVNKQPWASAGSDKIVSPKRPATFNAQFSRDPDGKITDYEWEFPDGKKMKGERVKYGFDKPGRYTVRLKVTDDTGSAFGYDSLYVTVNSPPIPIIVGQKTYRTGRIQLDASQSYDEDGEILDQFWVVNGKSITGPILNYKATRPGKYSVQYNLIDNSGTYSAVQVVDYEFTVNDLPLPDFSTPKVVAPSEVFSLDAAASKDKDGRIVKYDWDLGDGNTRNGELITHSFNEPGIYQIRLAVQDDQGLEESTRFITKEVVVNAPPIITSVNELNYVPNQSIEVDLSKSFDPDGEIKTYQYFVNNKWITGSNKQNLSFIRGNSSFKVAVLDNSSASNRRVEKEIKLIPNNGPVAIANEDVRSSSNIIQFDGSSSSDADGDELKYYWDFGDGDSSEGPITIHQYRTGGTFRALLTVDDQKGLSNSFAYDTVEVFINRPPEPYVELPRTICITEPLIYDARNSFEPDGSLLRYEWSFGDGSSALGSNGSHKYEREGKYPVTLTLDDNEGLDNSIVSYTEIVEIVGTPVADAGQNIVVCVGEEVQFDGSNTRGADSSIGDFTWELNGKEIGVGVFPTYEFSEPGTYRVKLIVTGDEFYGCSSSSSDYVNVTVKPQPLASFQIPDVIRVEDELELDASPSIVEGREIRRFTWEIEEIETINISSVSRYDSINGNRSFWEIRSSLPGRDSLISKSRSSKLPIIKRQLPRGEHRIQLQVEVEGTEDCNTALNAQYIEVRDRPRIVVADIPSLVPGVPFRFSGAELADDLSEIKSAYWNFGDGNTREGLFVNYAYTKPGTYRLTFIADDGSGTAKAITKIERDVFVNQKPKAILKGPSRALPGDVLTFNASNSSDVDGEIISYNWFFSDGYRATGPTVSHSFNRTGSFTVALTVTDNADAPNSMASTSKQIRVSNADDLALSIPETVCLDEPIDIVNALSIPTNDASRVKFYVGSKEVSYQDAQNLSFSFPGKYNLRIDLAARDTTGKVSTIRKQLIVNGPPEVFADVPSEITIGAANELATFDASKSFDPNGDLVRISWDFGDGETGFGKIVQHEYKRPGTYTVKLTIMDSKRMSCSMNERTFTVKVIRK